MKARSLFRLSLVHLFSAALAFDLPAQNVGIGTNDPQEKLHIQNGNVLMSTNTTGIGFTHYNPIIKLRGKQPSPNDFTGTNFGLDFELNSDLVGSIRAVSSTIIGNHIRISRSTPNAPDLVVSSNGNVGVGLTQPTAKFQVQNGNFRLNHTNGNPQIELQRGGENKGFIQLSGDNGENLRIGTFSGVPGSFVVRTGGEDQFLVNTDGNISVARASVTHRLNVAGGAKFLGDGELLQLNGNSNSRFIQFYRNNLAKAYIQLSGDSLAIGTSTGNDNGNLRLNGRQVVIGGTRAATGYKLSVGGRVICTELRVELASNWPDYVFDKDYPLASLEKVEAHIQQHKHLPRIPSSAQISEGGLHLGEMQRLQMEKIEELFLHVIALKKEVEVVKAENESLRRLQK